MIDLDELQKIAEAATPGPWSLDTERSGEWWIGSTLLGAPREIGSDGMYVTRKHLGRIDDNEADAEFIAAANPQAVLALIERVRFHAQQEAGLRDDIGNLEAERDAALTRIAEAAKLHRKYTYYEHEDSCPDTSEDHREEHHHEASDDIGEFYCDQMPTGDVVCDTCRDVNGDRMEWPCPTAVALGLNGGENDD